jgi:HPt (histidine-containing phosphotransfer) domain-containing protein
VTTTDDGPILDTGILDGLRHLDDTYGPGLFDELVTLFLADTQARLAFGRAAIGSGDTVALRRMARALQGSCAVMGGARMAAAAGNVERAVDAPDLARSETLFTSLEAEYVHLDAALGALRA